jgi:hypothetical protein
LAEKEAEIMSNQQVSQQPVGGPAAPSGAGTATYSAEVLQRLVDQAAYFNLHSTPDAKGYGAERRQGGNDIVGVRVCEELRRFDIRTYAPTDNAPFRATNTVGEIAGNFTHRWMFIPDDYSALLGCEPPATTFDPSRSQRFVMLDGLCKLGAGDDGFRGFGTGKTYPSTTGQRSQLLVTAIGTLVEGYGKFKGLGECTYVYCGTLDPDRGFTGNLMIRVMDPQGRIRTTGSLPELKRGPEIEPGVTYVLLRGQAAPSDLVAPRLGPGGQFLGLKVEQGVTMLSLDSSYSGRRGLQSVTRMGPSIGKLSGDIVFDPSAPGGTVRDPIPFTTADRVTFYDRTGRSVGNFLGDLVDGRVFNLDVPKGSGQKAIRFGGTGPLQDGVGVFEGIGGLMTDNSVVMFTPHVSASVYVLRINDAERKYRAQG